MKAKITVNPDFVIGNVDPRIYGGFAEHLGRCVYEGMYEPDHPKADNDGFRKDVLKLIRELKMPIMRYPGGNFVSGYNWEDGVGPKKARPKRLELAWESLETNQFGTNEFVDWCRKAETEPMLAVNLGTKGMDEARNLVEYCNHPGGTYYSDLRKKHGWQKPHNVKTWCLGNEVYGNWQMGHKSPEEYGKVALETAKLMKLTDPSIELVACGSGSNQDWNYGVLEQCYEKVDYLAVHYYFGNRENNTPLFLSLSEWTENCLCNTIACCDFIGAKLKSKKRLMLSVDEWNVWYRTMGIKDSARWTKAPHLLEEVYNMEDALMVGCILISMLNHCHRIKIGCLAQIVNVIAPIMAEKGGKAWKQTIFWPFYHAANLGHGTVLQQATESQVYNCQISKTDVRENIPFLKSTVILNKNKKEVVILAVNRNLDKKMILEVELQNLGNLKVKEWITMNHKNLKAENSVKKPNNVIPEKITGAKFAKSKLIAELAAASWNVITLTF